MPVKKENEWCFCCKPKKDQEKENKERQLNELVDNAPQKDELVTHNGVVYFPKELMPEEPEETLIQSARLGLHSN